MKKPLAPVAIVFIIVNCLVIIFRKKLEEKGVDTTVIIVGNLIVFATTVASSLIQLRAMKTDNAQALMRSVYSGFMLKFFVMLSAALIYIASVKPANRPALFTCMGLYLVYHFLGIQNVLKQKKPIKDGEGKTSL